MQCTMSIYEYPDGVLITVKKLRVECWTLHTLNGRHLGNVAEREGPPTYENGGQESCGGCDCYGEHRTQASKSKSTFIFIYF